MGTALEAEHGLTMADYDVLVCLAHARRQAVRMSDLAEQVLQPKSSITRIVADLERRGLVRRQPTPIDHRGTDAVLTSEGRRAFRHARATHLANVRRLFLDRLDPTQIRQLAAIWHTVDPAAVTDAGEETRTPDPPGPPDPPDPPDGPSRPVRA
jgi:DNA-binding MarR family transcriptional regulator